MEGSRTFTAATGVELPYDLKLMQPQMVADLKVPLSKEFDIVAEAPATPEGAIYTLDGEITAWHPGNAVLERKDTVRTDFYSQGAESTGTLAHPIAQKIADRIKEAKLK